MIRGFHHYDPSDVYSSRIYSNRLLYIGHILWFLSYLKGLPSRQRFISRVKLTCLIIPINVYLQMFQIAGLIPPYYINIRTIIVELTESGEIEDSMPCCTLLSFLGYN